MILPGSFVTVLVAGVKRDERGAPSATTQTTGDVRRGEGEAGGGRGSDGGGAQGDGGGEEAKGGGETTKSGE